MSFNKREDAFSNLKDYNDYLETVENISAYVSLIALTASVQPDQLDRRG